MTSSRQIYNRKLDDDRRYWFKTLATENEVMGFPLSLSPSATAENEWQSIDFDLPPAVCDRVNALTEGSPFLLYVLTVAAVKMCIQKYTGANLISVGSPCRLDGGTGHNQTLLPIIDWVDGQMTVRECLGSVRENLLDAYKHQDYPTELVLQELKLQGRDFDPAALNLVIAFDEIHQKFEPPADGILMKIFRRDNGIEGEIKFKLRADSYIFVARFIQHLITILQAALEDTKAKIAELLILSPHERAQLTEFAGPADSPEIRSAVHDLFSARALEFPEAVALIYQEQSFSYGKLNERANQMAHHLISLGIGPESLVAVCLERSPEFIITLLGILKAGGAYIPLDPGNPPARLALMLEDAKPAMLIAQGNLLDLSLPATTQAVDLGAEIRLIEKQPTGNPWVTVEPQNLAYCIYTSGSTGTPKAVGITHQALALRAVAMRSMYGISASDCMLQCVSLTFDAFGEELFPMLITGGSIVLPGQDPATLLPEDIVLLTLRNQVTILHFTATYWLRIVKWLMEAGREVPPSVRRTIVGGEPLPTEASVEWLRRASLQSRLFNAYGPTEATITTTSYKLTSLDASCRLPFLPIGRPLSGSLVYVINKDEQPCPVGLPGKLRISGLCLARGYLRQPALTGEKFIPDPFSGIEGSRMYCTGDLARWLDEGALEFLGRNDIQVKIRGYRIELGEIEAVLLNHPAVNQCLVSVYEDEKLNKRLAAYVVMKESATTTEALRAWLQERLPHFMVPSNFVELERLPVNSNGKADRRSLPRPQSNALNQNHVAAGTPVEKTLAEIWTQILGLETVSVHDNFFELGGDSILSIQVTARANEAGLRLTPQDIFKRQTIAELAQAAPAQKSSKAEQGIITGAVPLTPMQRWFFERELVTPDHFNQSVFLQSNRRLNPALLEQALARLLLHHDALRLRFSIENNELLQNNSGVEPDRVFTFIDLSDLPASDQRAALEHAAAEIQTSLNLRVGPLMRVALFDLGEGEKNRLLIVIHHLVVDGVSWRILLDDLQTSYEQLESGGQLALPPKSASFKQWAEQLQAFSQSRSLLAERERWAKIEAQDIGLLPIDYMTGPNDYASESVAVVELGGEETERLLRHTLRAHQASVDEILLTAMLCALTNWCGQQRLLIDMEGHGREDIFDEVETGRTVGWFTSLYPVLLRTAGPQLLDHLRSVKEDLRQIPHRGIGYGALRYLRNEPSLKAEMTRNSRAEIVFNYLGQFDHVFSNNSLFERSLESPGPAINAIERRPYLFEINSHISSGRLQLRWAYSRNLHLPETVERLANHLLSFIRDLIYLDEAALTNTLIPGDLLDGELTEEELDRILGEVHIEDS